MYNKIAGDNRERLAALSDGVFAVAMTLLGLDLHAPISQAITSEWALAENLLVIAPHLGVYFLSFLTLGIFWVGQQTQLNQITRVDRDLTWLHLLFLFIISLMPFSTSVMAAFVGFRLALLVYWLNIFLLGALLLATWRYAVSAGFIRTEAGHEVYHSVERRIVIAQSLYTLGAALCVINTAVSLFFIVLVQVNYALGPRIPGLRRL